MINIQLSFNTSCFAFQYIKRVNEQEIEIVRQNDREPERVGLKGWDQEKESYRNVKVGLRKEWMRLRERGWDRVLFRMRVKAKWRMRKSVRERKRESRRGRERENKGGGVIDDENTWLLWLAFQRLSGKILSLSFFHHSLRLSWLLAWAWWRVGKCVWGVGRWVG